MPFIRIVLLSILAAIGYGIIHDQVTARICVEYFTIGHPPIFHTDSPALLGVRWGILATWWVGLILPTRTLHAVCKANHCRGLGQAYPE